MSVPLAYAVVTPARNEAENLKRLADSLCAQSLQPSRWLIVDNGSTDGTAEIIDQLIDAEDWIRTITVSATAKLVRGGTVTRAFHAGLRELDGDYEVVAKVDADVSFPVDYFERLLEIFRSESDLGIASGVCFERSVDGSWQPRYTTDQNAWGAARAYREKCLRAVLPLEERMGWDGIDSLKAALHGWRTATLSELSFRHHRREGERDGARHRAWTAQGRAMHYMGYRWWYVAARTLFQARKDIAAAAMLAGFMGSAVRREAKCGDRAVRDYLRSRQTLRALPRRFREARGAQTDDDPRSDQRAPGSAT